MKTAVPTSVVLDDLLRNAPGDHVTLGWVIDGLRERSFGLVMLLLALIALVPGLSTFIGLLLILPAAQMMLARNAPVLPRFVARRPLPTRGLARLLARVVPVMRRLETVIRPRWQTPFEATKRVVGAVTLLLGLTVAAPLPFGHVIPAFAIMLVALAYLEEDGVVLSIALALAFASLAITAAAVWGTVAGVEFLERL